MANLGYHFDATQVDPSVAFTPVPAGDYLMHIIASDLKDNSQGTGKYLEIQNEIMDGEFKGTRVYDNLNIIHENAQAAEIANRTLSAICHAVGEVNVSDSDQLHFKPFIGVVRFVPAGHVTKGKNGKPDRVQQNAKNEMGGYKPASGNAPRVSAPASQTRQPPAQSRPATPPPTPTAKPANVAPWARAKTAA